MVEYAIEHNHKYGIAEANYCLAKCYHDTKQYTEAEKLYKLSYQKFANFESPYMSFMAGLNIFNIYLLQNRFDEALAISPELRSHIAYWESSKKLSLNPVMRTQLAINLAHLYCKMENAQLAGEQLDSVAYYTNIYSDHSQDYLINQVSFLYSMLKDDFKTAQEKAEWLISYADYTSNITLKSDAYYKLATLYQKKGNYEQAVEFYKDFNTYNDTVNLIASTRQLNMMNKTLNLNELQWDKEKAEARNLYFAIGLALVLIICCLMVVYSNKLKHRNLMLCHQVEEYARQHDEMLSMKSASVECRLSAKKDVPLFDKIEKLMHDEKLFCLPNFSRDSLAEKLGTNRTYVSDSIKNGYGKPFTEYLSDLRLTEAVKIIERKPNLGLTSISEQVGYTTYSTFLRSFTKRYGITPADYIKFIKM